MSVLPDHILEDIGHTLVDPFSYSMVQPASIDVHVDRYFIVAKVNHLATIDPAFDNDYRFEPMVEVSERNGFYLRPGWFVLASTFEKFTIPKHLVARFEGKSSLGRLGLMTHVTAGFIDPGFEGYITLELKNVTDQTIVIHPGMKIGQVCFEETADRVRRPYGDPSYGSHYQGQRGPTLSRSHMNFSKINVYRKDKNAPVAVHKEVV